MLDLGMGFYLDMGFSPVLDQELGWGETWLFSRTETCLPLYAEKPEGFLFDIVFVGGN